SVFKQRRRIVVLRELVITNHVEVGMPAVNSTKQFGALSHRGADEQAAVASASNGEFVGRCVFVLDQPFRRGDKVVKDILLFIQHACTMPCFAEFATAAQVSDGVEPSLLNPPRDEGIESRCKAHVEAAVTIEDRGSMTVRLEIFLVNERHRYFGPIFGVVPDLLGGVLLGAERDWDSIPKFAL